MSVLPCCGTKVRVDGSGHRPVSYWRRGGEIAGWTVPAATLALLPKCPACVATYVALATGLGISLPAATWLRAALLAGCIASLVFFAARWLRSLLAGKISP